MQRGLVGIYVNADLERMCVAHLTVLSENLSGREG
jgi:hypothetical protein